MDLILFFALWLGLGIYPAYVFALSAWKDTSTSTAAIGASVFVMLFLGPLNWVIILAMALDKLRGYRG